MDRSWVSHQCSRVDQFIRLVKHSHIIKSGTVHLSAPVTPMDMPKDVNLRFHLFDVFSKCRTSSVSTRLVLVQYSLWWTVGN